MLALRMVSASALFALSLAVAACHPSAGASAPKHTEAQAASAVPSLHAPLAEAFARWDKEGPSGDAPHQEGLQKLAAAVRQQLSQKQSADVLFVCTHNSRRSHMAQLLGLAAARRSGLSTVRTFSGGTEVTAFNPRAVAALQRVGFGIAAAGGAAGGAAGNEEKNPRHMVRFGPSAELVEAYSKRLTEAPNPASGFIVVMTCSQADAACPLVTGAVARVAIPYEDPKVADGTPAEAARYDERVAQIGRDMAWVFTTAASR